MNILHITSILPAPLEHSIPGNDIILRLAIEYENKYKKDRHYFLLVLPFTNKILSYFKRRWNDYYLLIKKGEYLLEGRKVIVIGIPAFKNDQKIRPLLTRIGYLLNMTRIKSMMEDIKPDIVHAHNLSIDMELAQIFKNKYHCEFIVTARNVNLPSLNRIKKGIINPKSILSVNYVTKEYCSRFLESEVNMIPHPVDSEFINDELSFKEKNNFLQFVSVCKLRKYKNIDKVLHALSILSDDFHYTIIGDGPEEEYLKDLVFSLGLQSKVTFLGNLPHENIITDLKNYDFFILLSYPETLGRVYFEALASGLPVLAAENTGVDGIIAHGVHGFIVKPYINAEISSTIKRIFEMTPEALFQMKKNAVLLSRNFTWDITLNKYHELYNG